VATRLGCGVIFNHHFIANLLRSPLVKELWKSVNILAKLRARVVSCFFYSRGTLHSASGVCVCWGGAGRSSRHVWQHCRHHAARLASPTARRRCNSLCQILLVNVAPTVMYDAWLMSIAHATRRCNTINPHGRRQPCTYYITWNCLLSTTAILEHLYNRHNSDT